MALEYSHDPKSGLITITSRGEVTVADRVKFLDLMLHAHELPETAPVLIDVSEVTNVPSTEEVEAIGRVAEQVQVRFGNRVAILNTKVGRATISRLVSLSVNEAESRVRAFVELEEARAWLLS